MQILKGKLVLPPYLSPEAKDFIRKVSIACVVYSETNNGVKCAFTTWPVFSYLCRSTCLLQSYLLSYLLIKKLLKEKVTGNVGEPLLKYIYIIMC